MLESMEKMTQSDTTLPGIFRPATAAAKTMTRLGGKFPTSVLTTPRMESSTISVETATTGSKSESKSGVTVGAGVGLESGIGSDQQFEPSLSTSSVPGTPLSRPLSIPGAVADDDDYLFGPSLTGPLSRRRAATRIGATATTSALASTDKPAVLPLPAQSPSQQSSSDITDNNKKNNIYRTLPIHHNHNDDDEEEVEERITSGRGKHSTENNDNDDDDILPPVELSPEEILRDKKHQRLSVQVD